LVDLHTNQLGFIKDVEVDEEVGPFQTSSEIKITKQQLVATKDSSIKLQATPPEREEDSKHEEFLRSDFDDTSTHTCSLDHGDNFDEEDPK
jgi:hypothetical protein